MDLTVLNSVSYGLYVVGAMDGARPTGCIINTVMQITSENPVLAISLNKENYTHKVIEATGSFSLSILSEQTDPGVISVFGFSSGRDTDKFNDFSYTVTDSLPLLQENCCGGLLLDVLQITDMETHSVIFARLSGTVRQQALPPMTYSYYHRVIKGRAPKSAPTYQPPVTAASNAEEEVYICNVCGYVHRGPLPDDFRCPVCGVDKGHFKKQ